MSRPRVNAEEKARSEFQAEIRRKRADYEIRQCDMADIGRATLQFARRMMQDPRYRDLIQKRAAELAARNKTEGTNKE